MYDSFNEPEKSAFAAHLSSQVVIDTKFAHGFT